MAAAARPASCWKTMARAREANASPSPDRAGGNPARSMNAPTMGSAAASAAAPFSNSDDILPSIARRATPGAASGWEDGVHGSPAMVEHVQLARGVLAEAGDRHVGVEEEPGRRRSCR